MVYMLQSHCLLSTEICQAPLNCVCWVDVRYRHPSQATPLIKMPGTHILPENSRLRCEDHPNKFPPAQKLHTRMFTSP